MAENTVGTAKRRRGPGKPFQPGVSGNPGGRPKGVSRFVREKYGEDGVALVAFLDAVFTGTEDPKTGKAIDASTRERIEAVIELLNRGWGKAGGEVEAVFALERQAMIERLTRKFADRPDILREALEAVAGDA